MIIFIEILAVLFFFIFCYIIRRMIDKAVDNKEFIDSFKKIALPVGLQNVFFISLQFIDALMVGRLGQTEYNAVGLGGQYLFLITVTIIGIGSALAIYMSQYFGNNDLKGYRKSVGLAIISCFILGVLAGGFALFFSEFIMNVFTSEPEIIKNGVKYLRIIAFQIPIIAITMPMAMASRAYKNAKLPLIISMVSLSINALLNYVLIFGKFGFPKLEIKGAAYATLLSSLISLLLYFIIIKSTDNPLRAPIKEFLNIKKAFVKKVVSTCWTVILHECLWSLGITIFVRILSKMNTDGYTSYQIAMQFIRFAFIFSMAISSSASVTIGIQLGRKDIEKALVYEKKYSKAQIIVGFLVAGLIILATYLMVDLFKVSETIKQNAFYMSIALSIFMPLKTYSGMQAAGILRAGGDTKVPVFFELIGIYFIDVPLLYCLLKFTSLATPVIIFFASMGSIVTSILLYKRVKSKKWAKNIISEK